MPAGEAMVFGWDQAITWDGRQVTPLLTDACRHLLVLLTHAAAPTAVTLHMEDLDTRPREVLTFFSGNNIVTLDSHLKVRSLYDDDEWLILLRIIF